MNPVAPFQLCHKVNIKFHTESQTAGQCADIKLQRDKRSTQVKRPLEQLNLRHKTLVSIYIFARYWSLLVIKVFSTCWQSSAGNLYLDQGAYQKIQSGASSSCLVRKSCNWKVRTCKKFEPVCMCVKGGCQFFLRNPSVKRVITPSPFF